MVNDFIEKAENIGKLYRGTPADEKQITSAEKALGLSFSKDYREYLKKYGIVSFDGHEFTGITKGERLNVVTATKTEMDRTIQSDLPLYVIERLCIDGIVIWQSSTGEIYETQPHTKPIKICNSLWEYLEK